MSGHRVELLIDADEAFRVSSGVGVVGRNLVAGLASDDQLNVCALISADTKCSGILNYAGPVVRSALSKRARNLYALAGLNVFHNVRRDVLKKALVMYLSPRPVISGAKVQVMIVHDLFSAEGRSNTALPWHGRRITTVGLAQAKAAGAHFVCVSRWTREQLLRVLGGYDETHVHVIYPGIHDEWLHNSAEVVRFAPPEDPVHGRGDHWVWCGYISKRKNVDRLLVAFAEFTAESSSRVQLIMVASPESEVRRAKALAARMGITHRVHFLDPMPLPNLIHLIRTSRGFVFPSEAEGFGLPVVEAAAVGVPVLTSDRSALPEVAGPGSVYVDPFDLAAIKAGLHRLWTDKSLGIDARALGREWAMRFSSLRQIAAMRDLLLRAFKEQGQL